MNMLPAVRNDVQYQQKNAELQSITAQIQAAVFMAKQCPRDIHESELRILKSCRRVGVAESAIYSFPRGGKNVTGASIRLAELVAREFGNMQFGVRELDRGDGWTKVETFAWDVETNFRVNRIFTVDHERDTKTGNKKLIDNRDIYEQVANISARRMRACILEIIPSDILETALNECRKTLESGITDSIPDQIKKVLSAFISVGVNKNMIESYLNHNIDLTTKEEIDTLREIYTALKDGHSKREDYFVFEETAKDKLNNILKEKDELKAHANK